MENKKLTKIPSKYYIDLISIICAETKSIKEIVEILNDIKYTCKDEDIEHMFEDITHKCIEIQFNTIKSLKHQRNFAIFALILVVLMMIIIL